jgi:hypothetical protein
MCGFSVFRERRSQLLFAGMNGTVAQLIFDSLLNKLSQESPKMEVHEQQISTVGKSPSTRRKRAN